MKTCMRAFALSAVLFAAPAIANEPSDTPVPVQAEAPVAKKKADERLVCERIRATGSNKVERVCKTAAQREEERNSDKSRNSREAAEQMTRGARPKLGDM